MHCLQYGTDASHAAVDVCISQEVSRQVAVQPGLDRRGRVHPQRRVEQHVVQELPCQEGLAKRLRSALTLHCPMVGSVALLLLLLGGH